jgi:hypothetical protein
MIAAILALNLMSGSLSAAGPVPVAPPPLQLAQTQQRPRDYSGLRREELQREWQQHEAARLEDLRRQDQTRQIWQGERNRLDTLGGQVENEYRQLEYEQRQLDLERRQLDIERQRLQPGN